MSTGTAMGAIVNGDFEAGVPPWLGFGGGGACDAPKLYSLASLGEGGTTVAWLGDDPTTPGVPGCNPSVIYQHFDCDGPGNLCVVEFDALFFRFPGEAEVAYAFLKTDAGIVKWYIPPNRFSNDVRIAATCNGPDCGLATVGFVLYDAGGVTPGVQSILIVDNVESDCRSVLPVIHLAECVAPDCPFSDEDDPNEPPVGPGTGVITTGACCGSDDCLTVTNDVCEPSGYGKYAGDNEVCAEVCPDPIPAVSEWGMAVLVLLILSAATVVIVRRRAMVT
jgi:hypothetical protein